MRGREFFKSIIMVILIFLVILQPQRSNSAKNQTIHFTHAKELRDADVYLTAGGFLEDRLDDLAVGVYREDIGVFD